MTFSTGVSRRSFLGALALTAALPGVAAADQRDPVLDWYDLTSRVVSASGMPTQVTNTRSWAVSWLAAARAVTRCPDHGVVAMAAALHACLTTLVPGKAAELDAALAETLAGSPDARRAVRVGREQAAVVLASRAGDGLDPASVTVPFAMPAPGLGVYALTPPAFTPAQQSGTRFARPFLLSSGAQFRVDPPAYDSAESVRDLAEVRAIGALDAARTPWQTDTALFWNQPTLPAYIPVVRAALLGGGSLLRRVTLVAAFHTVSVDVSIATSDAKYHYATWRPITAIHTAFPGVPADPTWTPLIATPPHPEYLSGHAAFAGFAEQVLTLLAGPQAARPFTLTSPTAPGVTRGYQRWADLTRDVVDARVWSGVHLRGSDVTGAEVGRRIARYGLTRLATLLS